ncbi:DUF4124 domain-containing protein [Neisseria perflava]|uniref:DUF4124 domain-containing protein n=1 Tax=Neisseria perflava TaxID=33053 RepID=UPI00209CD032|nr:DUF4124 domain-containing protein [Neisseria perflava]MCP1659599.1 septal ring factor EnvC (AmiA/AmiB activator) [Neisseria perflava]MCP1772420.1 septal ring factor EnvC (AmiA/AmiB activator) [Neisseria perflava]
MKNIPMAALLLFCLSAPVLQAAEVYTWKNRSGSNTYSDVPNRLQPALTGKINVRTQTVSLPAAASGNTAKSGSIAEQQQQLNNKITQANKQIEEQNQKIAEAARQQKEDNCKTAQLNRQFAESARANNRSALIQRYDSDIAKYCN